MGKFARVTSTSVSACNPAIGEIDFHHVVDILEDNLVAVKENNALHNAPVSIARIEDIIPG